MAAGAAVAALAAGGAVWAWQGTRSLEAAPAAGEPACARALALAPATVLEGQRVPLGTAGALAWGTDPQVLMRCGVLPPGPSTLPCLDLDGIEWIFDQDVDPVVYTTYGRAPALDVRVPRSAGADRASAALGELRAVAQALPRTGRECVG